MQLSPALKSAENVQAAQIQPGAEDSGVMRRAKAGKKDGLGVFGKLLAGLLKNTHSQEACGQTEASGLTGAQAPGKKPGAVRGKEAAAGEKADELSAGVKVNSSRRKAGSKAAGGGGAAIGEKEQAPAALKGENSAREPAKKQKIDDEAALAALPQPLQDAPDSGWALLFPNGGAGEAGGFAGIRQAALAAGEPLPEETGISSGEMAALSDAFAALTGKGLRGRRNSAHAAAGKEETPADKPAERIAGRKGREPAAETAEKTGKSAAMRDRRKERLDMQVQDWRMNTPAQVSPQAELAGREGAGAAAPGEAELSLELPGSGRARGEIRAEGESRPAASFQDMLARELRQNFGGDIVRHAAILLRDGGEGTIRLSLKPESLGNVKIQLEMAENKVTGHIIVESDEAFRAFEREIRSLEQAFKESGFDGASLQMAVASGSGQEGRGRQGSGADFPGAEEYAARIAASGYDRAGEDEAPAEEYIFSSGQGQSPINMLV
ncbi:MAG: flagellar hook-length control protein FliK [Treponema sp.]|jgi:hypothetical protein|nr:flagellar hook-length control protein FliK [Treponema sp.]